MLEQSKKLKIIHPPMNDDIDDALDASCQGNYYYYEYNYHHEIRFYKNKMPSIITLIILVSQDEGSDGEAIKCGGGICELLNEQRNNHTLVILLSHYYTDLKNGPPRPTLRPIIHPLPRER